MLTEPPSADRLDLWIHLWNRLNFIIKTDFQPLSDEQLAWSPQAKEIWSIGQCLEHLRLLAQAYWPIFQALSPCSQAQWSPPTWLARYLLHGLSLNEAQEAQKLSQSLSRFSPPAWHKPRQFWGEFQSLQKQYDQAFDQIRQQKGLKKQSFRLPDYRFCWLNACDTLRVFIRHWEKHVVQAQKIRLHEGFPLNHNSPRPNFDQSSTSDYNAV